jgi:cytochrome P450
MLSLDLAAVPRQLRGRSPFEGTVTPSRVPFVAMGSGRAGLPFPHPWNFREPLKILDAVFHGADEEEGSRRHNRYLDVPGFVPVLVTRDPSLIRAISAETGDKPGQFDRDTLPSAGIARATGEDTLLYANGETWKRQKRLAMPPFSRTSLFQPEQFQEFEETFRRTASSRLDALRRRVGTGGARGVGAGSGGGVLRLELEPEIKAIMLEMLVNNFFGAELAYEQIRDRYVPALDCVIADIVRDTVVRRFGLPGMLVRGAAKGEVQSAKAAFEELTDAVLAKRAACKGQWGQFKSDAPDGALRSNIRVFLAGALEATTSYAAWAISHLARNRAARARLAAEVDGIDSYSPETLHRARYLSCVLDETLRLTPALYFHPRRPTVDTWVNAGNGATLKIPKGTHILLDVWHANRHDDHWGPAVTGSPAEKFVPERWEATPGRDARASDLLHFGFGHGPRFCPGKSLGQIEVALVVGGLVKLFEFEAVNADNPARAGVSTKPADGVLVDLRERAGAGGVAFEPGPVRTPERSVQESQMAGDAYKTPTASDTAAARSSRRCPLH